MEKLISTGIPGVYTNHKGEYILKMRKYSTIDFGEGLRTDLIAEIVYNLSREETMSHTQFDNPANKTFYPKKDIPKEGIKYELQKTIIPSNRVNIDRVLKEYGLKEYDILKMFILTNGREVNKLTWYQFENETFEDVSNRKIFLEYKDTIDDLIPNGLV